MGIFIMGNLQNFKNIIGIIRDIWTDKAAIILRIQWIVLVEKFLTGNHEAFCSPVKSRRAASQQIPIQVKSHDFKPLPIPTGWFSRLWTRQTWPRWWRTWLVTGQKVYDDGIGQPHVIDWWNDHFCQFPMPLNWWSTWGVINWNHQLAPVDWQVSCWHHSAPAVSMLGSLSPPWDWEWSSTAQQRLGTSRAGGFLSHWGYHGVSPNHSYLSIGFSINKNHPALNFWGTPIYGNSRNLHTVHC